MDPFAFQMGPPAPAAGMGMGGMGMQIAGGLGAKPAGGLGAPQATASASSNKGLSLEDSLMANLAGLSMTQPKVQTLRFL